MRSFESSQTELDFEAKCATPQKLGTLAGHVKQYGYAWINEGCSTSVSRPVRYHSSHCTGSASAVLRGY